MKLKYIFASIVATLALAVSCTKEADQHYLKEIKVSTSYVSLATTEATNSTAITVTATDSWTISVPEDAAKWLTVTPTSGSAGETQVTFSAAAGEGNTAEVLIKCGEKTQRVNVIQGLATVSNATCKEVLDGPDSKTYRVTGVVTSIANTTYGNWYLNDGIGEVYIYGTLDSKGATKNFLSWGLEVGDEITVEGPKTTYNGTVELVDVTVIKITKSLIKVETVDPEDATIAKEGGDLVVTLTNKGNNLSVEIPEDVKAWLGISALAGDVVTLTAAANEGGDREGTVIFKTTDGKKDYTAELTIAQKGAIIAATVKEFLDAAVGTTLYKVTGVITKVANTSYGNVYLKDFSGEAYVYGIGAKGDFEKLGIKEGDIVTLVGQRGEFNGSAQMSKAQYDSHIAVTEVTIPEFLAGTNDTYYRVSGTIKEIANATYGNMTITDGTNDLYVYGCYPGVGATGDNRKNLVATLGIEVGDEITVFGPRGVKNDVPQVNGGFFWSLEKGTAGGDEPGGDEPGTELGEFDTNVTYTLGSSSYNDGVINVTLGENTYDSVFTLKFGTSKKYGDATITLPAGTKKVSYYAIAWKGNPATLKFTVGENESTQDIAANDGATGNSPYTATVTASDKYEITFDTALAAETTVKVETCAGTNTGYRAIIFGIQATK